MDYAEIGVQHNSLLIESLLLLGMFVIRMHVVCVCMVVYGVMNGVSVVQCLLHVCLLHVASNDSACSCV